MNVARKGGDRSCGLEGPLQDFRLQAAVLIVSRGRATDPGHAVFRPPGTARTRCFARWTPVSPPPSTSTVGVLRGGGGHDHSKVGPDPRCARACQRERPAPAASLPLACSRLRWRSSEIIVLEIQIVDGADAARDDGHSSSGPCTRGGRVQHEWVGVRVVLGHF